MKITEELITEAVLKIRPDTAVGFERIFETIREHKVEVLQSITGKIVNVIPIYSCDVILDCVKNAVSTSQNYILNEFCEKFNLTPAFNLVVSGGEKNIKKDYTTIGDSGLFDGPFNIDGVEIARLDINDGKVISMPTMLLGDNLFITLGRSRWQDDNGTAVPFMYITSIYYTSDKTEEVVNIINTLHEELNTLERRKVNNDEIKIGFVYRATGSELRIKEKYVKVSNITLDEFNENLPNEKIINEINKDSSGVLIFHGEPGCGKSSYIKYLIQTCNNKNFIILSQDLLAGDMEKFRKLLLDVKGTNSIFIIEDCENLVKSRESVGSNMIISDFLNITDGIYGDMFKMKFILTFNTEIRTIDQALLRKGRLKCKYRFEKLKGEKLVELAKKLGVEIKETKIIETGMSLADLYNSNEDNGADIKKATIGF